MLRMTRLFWMLMAAFSAANFALCQEPAPTPANTDGIVFREPFTLRLHVDKDHYYEEHYDKRIPYVAKNDVYLFSGEKFGVSLTVKADKTVEVTYQPDGKKADVWFIFTQEKELASGAGMMLTIQNKLKRELRMDALMTVPGKKEIYKTSIVPNEAGLSNFESWPHPIVQLVLRNFRLSEKEPGKSKR